MTIATENQTPRIWNHNKHSYSLLSDQDRKDYHEDFEPIVVQCFSNKNKYHVFKRVDGILYYLQCGIRTQEKCNQLERELRELGRWTKRRKLYNRPYTELRSRLIDREDGRGVTYWSACTKRNNETGELTEGHGWLCNLFFYLDKRRKEMDAFYDFHIDDLDRGELHDTIRYRKKVEARGFNGRGFACSESAIGYRTDSDNIEHVFFSGLPSLKLIRETVARSEVANLEEVWIEGRIYVEADWASNPIEGRANAEPTNHFWTVTIAVNPEPPQSILRTGIATYNQYVRWLELIGYFSKANRIDFNKLSTAERQTIYKYLKDDGLITL